MYPAALKIIRTLQDKGYTAYIVGGAVRDSLLGITPHEIDVVTSALPGTVEDIFPRCHKIGASFGIITVTEESHGIEVATFREERDYRDGRHPEEVLYTDDPELDAVRRDFTVNAMFYDPIANKLLDFTGGRADLAAGILRTVGEADTRFREDYLRILRAVRFATRFGFKYASGIKESISKLTDKLSLLSVERIRDEINKMLTGPRPAVALRIMHELGILNVVLPELAELEGVEQPEKFHPEGDVFVHTVLMLEHMALPNLELAWSILLHDVGKPETQTFDEDGIPHFYRHDRASADLSEKILSRLKFPGKIAENITHAVKNHMRYAHVTKMKTAKVKRLMAEPTFPLELELHRVDCISSHARLDNYVFLLDKVKEADNKVEIPQPLITGNDLLKMGFKPGPFLGSVLREIADMQLEGELLNSEEAKEYVKKNFMS